MKKHIKNSQKYKNKLLQMLYSIELTNDKNNKIIDQFKLEDKNFIKNFLKKEKIINLIFKNNVKNSSILNLIEKIIIKISIFDMFYRKNILKKHVINDAILLSKKFCKTKSYAVINKILDKIAKTN